MKMKTTTKTATITTERGTIVNMTVIATRGFEMVKEISFCDGDNVKIERGKETNETNITLEINGKTYAGYFTTRMTLSELKGCYGVFLSGKQPIGLSKVKYNDLVDVVNATKKEAETDKSWVELQVKKAEALKAEMEYQKNCNVVKNAMSF